MLIIAGPLAIITDAYHQFFLLLITHWNSLPLSVHASVIAAHLRISLSSLLLVFIG